MRDDEQLDPEAPCQNEAKEECADDSPAALVRKDTLWINCVRVFLTGTLLIVAVGLSFATFKVASRYEYDNYRGNFQRIAVRIAYNFVDDINSKIWTARLATYALRPVSSDGSLLDLDRQILDDLTFGSKAVTLLEGIQWSPLLWNETEKAAWETYARHTKQENNELNAISVCHVCGVGMGVGTPEKIVTTSSYGNFPCGFLQRAALGGLMTSTACGQLAEIAQANCQCQPTTSADPNASKVATTIFQIQDGKQVADDGPYPMSPIWKASPQPPDEALLYNQMRDPIREKAMLLMIESKLPTLADTRYPEGEYEDLLNVNVGTPKSAIFFPVFGNGAFNETVVGTVALDIVWSYVFGLSQKLPWESFGVTIVIDSNHGESFTFEITDRKFASFVGEGDLHDRDFDSMMFAANTSDAIINSVLRAAPVLSNSTEVPDAAVQYNLRIYPTEEFKGQFITKTPIIYSSIVASIFIFTTAIGVAYDILVRRRNRKVMQSAEQSNFLLTSTFPDFIKNRLMARVDSTTRATTPWLLQSKENSMISIPFAAPKHHLKKMLGKAVRRPSNFFHTSEPIADFFPNVTVIFADIAGFTAWSSEREPTQVFQLLETLYDKFDALAEKHGAFKVETIGDCYVAVCGLPEPQTDHAVRVTRFGHDIMIHMHELVASLESQLGPGTGSLSIRVGLHSGAVTGGVLRGERSRFQLFGDTMNMASRMQTTGEANKIQISETTASLLMEQGCGCWIERRATDVLVKGKGNVRTYWAHPSRNCDDNTVADSLLKGTPMVGSDHIELHPVSKVTTKEPLVKWNADLLEKFLKQVVAGRLIAKPKQRFRLAESCHLSKIAVEDVTAFCDHAPIDDVTELIVMSDFGDKNGWENLYPESVELSESVCFQLREYVARVADKYRENAFHNFEHACHVAMSANKIIKRIVRPEDVDYLQQNVKRCHRKHAVAKKIHHSTFGISSDALMQFALIFSAVIHDVDHTGVSNAQLIKKNDELATRYNNKSVAEQHSIQVAWDILMEEQFSELRKCIYTSEDEKRRFRQLIVNAVLSTDIFDKDLQALRKKRWDHAFPHSVNDSRVFFGDSRNHLEQDGNNQDDMSRKATVVFEYIIQASDVAHTMQHWHIYQRWNERFFAEQYRDFCSGREERDPSLGWYQGEIWFFDNYVIPLARKLETCGVFGVSSDEYLNYALENRHEWELKGRDIVEGLVAKYSADSKLSKVEGLSILSY